MSFTHSSHVLIIQRWSKIEKSFLAHQKYESNSVLESEAVKNELAPHLGKEGSDDKEKVTKRIKIAK